MSEKETQTWCGVEIVQVESLGEPTPPVYWYPATTETIAAALHASRPTGHTPSDDRGLAPAKRRNRNLGLILFAFLVLCGCATSPRLKPIAPNTLHGSSFVFNASTVKATGDRQYEVRLFGTMPNRNDGRVIEPAGMSTLEYFSNPIVLSMHDMSSFESVVGRCERIGAGENDATATITLLPKPAGYEGNWLPDTLDHFLSNGIAGVSVHVTIQQARPPTAEDYVRYGPECTGVIEKCRLVEVSVVVVGAFADAVPVGRGNG